MTLRLVAILFGAIVQGYTLWFSLDPVFLANSGELHTAAEALRIGGVVGLIFGVCIALSVCGPLALIRAWNMRWADVLDDLANR